MGVVLTLPLSFAVNILASHLPGATEWLKWAISYICLFLHRRLTKKRFDLYDSSAENDPYKLGFLVPPQETELESPHEEEHLQHAADEILCYGVNSKSECLVTRVARGCNQESEAWIYLKLANGNTYRLPPNSSHYQQPYSDKCTTFSCGGLQMNYIIPMRRWRIFYNGLLSEQSKDNAEEERIVHVKFALLWHCSSDPFDFSSHTKIDHLAAALSTAEWNSPIPPVKRLYKLMDFYSQGGVMMGTVNIGDEPEQEVYLWGSRFRFLGDTSHMEGANFVHILGTVKNGSSVHLVKSTVPNMIKNLNFGYVMQSRGSLHPLESGEIVPKVQFHQENKGCESDYVVKFKAGRDYHLDISFVDMASTFSSNNWWGGSIIFNHVNIVLNDYQGSGIVIVGEAQESRKGPPSKISLPITPKVSPLVIEFGNKICQIANLTGGKGSSLGKLTEISGEVKTFVVPKGVVVTTAAYEEFLDNDIEVAVKVLEGVAYGKTSGDLKAACERVSNVVTNKKMPDKVCRAIEQSLRHIFGLKISAFRFAVRSSATGEDTEQMSAAGQMDTFLGVRGMTEILMAVKKSWASQFGFIAVEYKRRYGQVLNSPMAVVIQEMVPCEVAGVLFTCDPLTGNPEIISITANYGLGESVVSGSSEPDTVTLKRSITNQLSVTSTTIGEKGTKILMDASGGTVEESVDESRRRECCLTGEKALRLAKIALAVEESYRSTRDIEWGIINNQIFLFQSRPVTSGTGETDFEIRHDSDGPLRSEDTYITITNVGEVMPGATCPLGTEIISKLTDIAMRSPAQSILDGKAMSMSEYFPSTIFPVLGHIVFDLIGMMYRFETEENQKSILSESMMISMLGRILDDPVLLSMAKERQQGVKQNKFMVPYVIGESIFFPDRYAKKVQKKFRNFRIPLERYSTARELFNALTQQCSSLSEVTTNLMSCSTRSSLWNMFMLSTLASYNGGFDTDVFRDFAFLLSTCTDVESADVPAAMQSLAYTISREIDPVAFKAMDVEAALKWLQDSANSAGSKFRDFIERHGHRCLKEFDIHSVTWGMDPRPLVRILQGMVSKDNKDTVQKEEMNTDDVLSKLSTPLNFKYRWILKFLLPFSRSGVRARESSKSMMVKGVHHWRKACGRLAELMVQEGRIPDKDLFYFFHLDELDELLKTRSPKLISKAHHRRRLFPEMDKYIFPEIMKGYPNPINLQNSTVEPTEGEFTMKGVPVSQGVFRGYARVAMNLEEAASLKNGEVLIAHSTDIGWSPYFPILGGVVTELGGLISHGAVVAREYGLPCVVGLRGATRHFQTGDYVLLDGNKGILKRLPKEDKTS